MPLPIALLTLATTASTGFAECAAPQDTFLSCTFSNGRKAVDVCVEGDNLTYSFGRIGKTPDLVMSVSIVGADYTPWPGIGRAIWETVTFHNQQINYEVSGVLNRIYPENENEDIQVEVSGAITVTEGDKTLAILECDAGSAEFSYGGSIYDAKIAAGQCWDFDGKRWGACK